VSGYYLNDGTGTTLHYDTTSEPTSFSGTFRVHGTTVLNTSLGHLEAEYAHRYCYDQALDLREELLRDLMEKA
jgi:hypothetical protein